MKRKIIYTDAPPEIEEAFARSRRIPNFIDIDSLVRRDDAKSSNVVLQPKSRFATARPKTSAMA